MGNYSIIMGSAALVYVRSNYDVHNSRRIGNYCMKVRVNTRICLHLLIPTSNFHKWLMVHDKVKTCVTWLMVHDKVKTCVTWLMVHDKVKTCVTCMLYFLRAKYFANCRLEGYHHSCEWLLLAASFVHHNLHICSKFVKTLAR